MSVSLPLDLLFPVLDEVRLSDAFDGTATRTTLQHLCRVSKVFRHFSQPLLYASPLLTPPPNPSDADSRPLADRVRALAVTLAARPDLAAAVEHLPLGVWTTWLKDEARMDLREVSRLAVTFVELCPNLSSLAFPNVAPVDVGDLMIASRRCVGLREFVFGEGVEKLENWAQHLDSGIAHHYGNATWSIQEMGHVMERWTNLRKLVLKGPLKSSREDEATLPCRLEEFHCELSRQSILTDSYLARILGNSVGTLRVLTLTQHQLAAGALISLIKNFGATLTSFTLLSKYPTSHDPLLIPTLLEFAPNLNHLVLQTSVELSPTNISLLAQLPLQHLELRSPTIPFLPREAKHQLSRFHLLKRFVLGRPVSFDLENGSISVGWGKEETEELVERMEAAGLELEIY
ncbi:hypothetical protein MNV49_001089 [Pseudohyphozyma bogoriensis]|nr:hypothetical protein MNV49_001089 [Pseudohyphozyma bogoriensis]